MNVMLNTERKSERIVILGGTSGIGLATAERAAVEEAERWGDEELQMVARRLALAAAMHGPDALANRGDDGRLGPLLFRSTTVRRAGVGFIRRFVFDATAGVGYELTVIAAAVVGGVAIFGGSGSVYGAALGALLLKLLEPLPLTGASA